MSALPIRSRLRVLRMELAILLAGKPRGWFIPYRYAPSVRAPVAYPALDPLFAAASLGAGMVSAA